MPTAKASIKNNRELCFRGYEGLKLEFLLCWFGRRHLSRGDAEVCSPHTQGSVLLFCREAQGVFDPEP
jgi:hypothetical protein